MLTRSDQTRRLISGAVIGSVAVVALAACGSSSGSNTSAGSAAPTNAPASAGPGGGGQRPAASGLIAAVDGTTMQVQSQQSGQTAVTWGDSTTFRHTVTAEVSSLKAGDCVTAVAPTGTDQAATSFTATTVSVTESTNGQCGRAAAGGAPGGGLPNGAPSGRPSGAPSGGTGTFGGVASGAVVSVSGSTIVIAAQSFGSNAATTTDKTITVDAGTKVTTQDATTSASVAVGKCATVTGTSDSSGAVAATSVTITDADNGECTGGFGGFNGNR